MGVLRRRWVPVHQRSQDRHDRVWRCEHLSCTGEDVPQGHPDVADVAVFGVPDEEYGESVHAALKLVAGRRATAEEVLLWCEGKIGKFQLPREHNVSFHAEEFPRSEAGKLRKKVLKDLVLA